MFFNNWIYIGCCGTPFLNLLKLNMISSELEIFAIEGHGFVHKNAARPDPACMRGIAHNRTLVFSIYDIVWVVPLPSNNGK